MTPIRRITTVSALLANAEGRVLAQLRDDKPGLPFANCWSTLGGRVEDGETPESAMQRELIEEIEICPPLRFWRVFEVSYEAHGVPMVSEVHVFTGRLDLDPAQIRLHEGQRVAYLGMEDIDRLPFAYRLDLLFRAYFAEGDGGRP
jgi:8-oxo-dGTP diphosphatase